MFLVFFSILMIWLCHFLTRSISPLTYQDLSYQQTKINLCFIIFWNHPFLGVICKIWSVINRLMRLLSEKRIHFSNEWSFLRTFSKSSLIFYFTWRFPYSLWNFRVSHCLSCFTVEKIGTENLGQFMHMYVCVCMCVSV